MTVLAESTPITAARQAFAGRGRGYLAACTSGIPAQRTVERIQADLDRWASGRADAGYWSDAVERVRNQFARLMSTPVDRVAVGSQASAFAALLATWLPDNAIVLVPEGEFSSMVLPFVQQAHRGIRIRQVPLKGFAEAVTEDISLAAFSLVQSATGEVAEADAIREACARRNVVTACDTTQAAGWVPIDATRFDLTICHTYKWLCAPRGVMLATVGPRLQEMTPIMAGWYAGEDPWATCYGPDGKLAATARRFDVSPPWQAFSGAEPALELFTGLDISQVNDYNVGLANDFRAELGMPPGNSAIVTWPDPGGRALEALTRAGICASGRAGNARVAFHLWNDSSDVEDAVSALRLAGL